MSDRGEIFRSAAAHAGALILETGRRRCTVTIGGKDGVIGRITARLLLRNSSSCLLQGRNRHGRDANPVANLHKRDPSCLHE
jgi:hypothetical protein